MMEPLKLWLSVVLQERRLPLQWVVGLALHWMWMIRPPLAVVMQARTRSLQGRPQRL
jgi:hypothetical protein